MLRTLLLFPFDHFGNVLSLNIVITYIETETDHKYPLQNSKSVFHFEFCSTISDIGWIGEWETGDKIIFMAITVM